MPTYEGAFRSRHDDTAEFRTVHEFIHDRIIQMGFDNPTVSGQIDFATVLRPSASQEGGFRVYAFSDALQATTPIFFRIGYGTSAISEPNLDLSIGFGYDNFGNIITTGSSAEITGSKGAFTPSLGLDVFTELATPHSHSWSGDGSRLTAALWYTSTNTSIMMVLERTKDENGVDDERGVLAIAAGFSFRGCHALYIQSGSDNEQTGVLPVVRRLTAGAVSSSFGNFHQVSVVRIPGTFGIETPHGIITTISTEFPATSNAKLTIFPAIGGKQIPFRIYPTNLSSATWWHGTQGLQIGLRFQE